MLDCVKTSVHDFFTLVEAGTSVKSHVHQKSKKIEGTNITNFTTLIADCEVIESACESTCKSLIEVRTYK